MQENNTGVTKSYTAAHIETLREEIKKSISKTYKTEDILLQTDFTLRGKEIRVPVPNLSRSLYIPILHILQIRSNPDNKSDLIII